MRRGFSFIELLIALALIAILSGIVVKFLNPAQQLAKARNTQRSSDVSVILTAISQNLFDNKGTFTCAGGAIPTSSTKMANAAGSYHIGPCLVPTYLDKLPFDPSAAGAHYASSTDYDTGYFIQRNASSGRITVNAPAAELGKMISVTR